MMLTACEWLDIFIDQQKQVRRADLKNGWWELEKGIHLDITTARIRIGRFFGRKKLPQNANHATFRARLAKGKTRLHTWFDDSRGQPIVGAYYVHVRKFS
ncbi:MAG: hypothetical protein ABF384_18925 [Verrucomicrobiales bacterium]